MIQDWGVTYDEFEPFYDRFEYPNPPTDPTYAGALFANAAVQLGYTPFQMPSANMTRPYTNFEGISMQACTVCGFCERFACEHFAKASPQTTILPKALSYPNVELRTRAHVRRVLLDSERKRGTAVLYVDGAGQEVEQPAEIVILCAFALNNVKLLLNSGIGQPYDSATGQGTIGRNYTYQTMAAVNVFYPESVRINPFIGAGALRTVIDDYNGDNFDHAGLGFVGGEIVVPSYRPTPDSIVPYQMNHNTGGAVMGTDPKTSVVNRYLQSWDVSNVFVQGACASPQNPGYNPTGTVGALVYWTVKAIREQNLKHPGPLVR